jgi:hypothetical protein
MITDKVKDSNVDELALKEAELFVKRLFVQGDYKHFAEKLQLNRDDLKTILYEASLFLSKKNIQCSIAIILKSIEENRQVFVSRTGTGSFFIINSQSVRVLNLESRPGDILDNKGPLEKPQLYIGKMKREDTLLLCSENLNEVIELPLMQRIIISSKSPEEMCKNLLHSASVAERKDNISIAVFNGEFKRKSLGIQWLSRKIILFIITPLLLILIGFLIYNLSIGAREKPSKIKPFDTFESLNLSSKIKENNPTQPLSLDTPKSSKEDSVKKPINNIKKNKNEKVNTSKKIEKKLTNPKFIVTGSVVLISNWELVKQGILFINWESGISYIERFHKYADNQSIPPSVKVTFIDHSTKIYNIK